MNVYQFAAANAWTEFGVLVQPTEKDGPRECCAEFASVTHCDGETDYWECHCCGRQWTAPCRPAEAIAPVEGI
jgi:hypothetical protein